MKLGVTGGAGFIGHHLVCAAVARGHSVVVLDSLRRGSFERLELAGADLRRGDVRDRQACAEAFSGLDCVIHLAAQSNVMGSQSDADFTFETNVTGTWNVVRGAQEADVPHVIFSSSREVYGEAKRLPVDEGQPFDPHNLYGASKAAGEMLLRALPAGGPAVSILRLANVIGSGDSGRVVPLWIDAARSDSNLCIFGGSQILDFVPVEFVVEACLRVAERGPLIEPVNIGSGIGTTLQQLANKICEFTGSKSSISILPARGPEVRRFVADTRRMQRVLGMEPPVDPLASINDWWRAG